MDIMKNISVYLQMGCECKYMYNIIVHFETKISILPMICT